MWRPCISCGEPGTESRCAEHRREARRDVGWTAESARRGELGLRSAASRGYDSAWRRLADRAKRAQPFCSDCGHWGSNGNPLTVDHSVQAWDRRSVGLPIRLCDVDVVCRRCNSARGPARDQVAS